MWGRESDPLRFQLSAANPKATPWGERERTAKIFAALTQRVHMRAGGVNPVSNKLGLTLVNPTTTGASAATQNEIPGPLTSTYPWARTGADTQRITRKAKHTLSIHNAEDPTVSYVWCLLGLSSCICWQLKDGSVKPYLLAFPRLMISITNMISNGRSRWWAESQTRQKSFAFHHARLRAHLMHD